MARRLAVPGLDVGHRSKRVQDLARRDARCDLAAGRARRQCRRVDLAVLANLQRQAVEAERVELPSEVLDVAVDDTFQVQLQETRGNLVQLTCKAGGVAVA